MNTNTRNGFGVVFSPERILAIRRAMNLTQEQFSATLGVTFSTVNRWERGKTTPNLIARRILLSLESRYVSGRSS